MDTTVIYISVVVPFYNGNDCINDLLKSVEMSHEIIARKMKVLFEVIIINDSPLIKVILSSKYSIPVRIICNEQNIGIHASRIKGIKNAYGNWILLLDQDDLIIPTTFLSQIRNISNANIIVGNGYYFYGKKKKKIFSNLAVMKYSIQEKNLIGIRNLIPSPGECLINKTVFPEYWLNHPMTKNGADDWMLWLLMLNEKRTFYCNDTPIYIHRTIKGRNLSSDLERMYVSCLEMCELLKGYTRYDFNKYTVLKRAVVFKFLFNTKKLNFINLIKLYDRFWANVYYKLKTKALSVT